MYLDAATHGAAIGESPVRIDRRIGGRVVVGDYIRGYLWRPWLKAQQ
jgi:hypothetical protein